MGPKIKAASLLLAMYALGIVSGVAWQTFSAHQHTHQMLADRRILKLKKELNLSPWQENVLREIVQDARDRARDVNDAVNFDLAQIHEDSMEAIQQLLTPEQQQRFEKFHKKSHTRLHGKDGSDDMNPKGTEGSEEVSTS